MTAWIWCVAAFTFAGVLAEGRAASRGHLGAARRLQGALAAGYAALGLLDAAAREWAAAAVTLACAAFWFWLWRRNRRDRKKRMLRLLGHKARARLEAMARNMPRPSPRLVPQGNPA